MMNFEEGNLCLSDTDPNVNDVTAWSMVFSLGGGYAQSGIMLRYGWTCWKTFGEQRLNPFDSPVFSYGSCIDVGSTHRVWQQAVNITGVGWRLRSNIDSTILVQSGFDPFDDWTGPLQVAFDAEAHHNNSDIPGYMTSGYPPPTEFTSMQVQSYSDNNFYDTCGYVYLAPVHFNDPYRYSTDAPKCDHVRVWTSG